MGAGVEGVETQRAESSLIQQVLHTVCSALIPRPIRQVLTNSPAVLYYQLTLSSLYTGNISCLHPLLRSLTASQLLPRRQWIKLLTLLEVRVSERGDIRLQHLKVRSFMLFGIKRISLCGVLNKLLK